MFEPDDSLYDNRDPDAEWDELPGQVQEDLLAWLNVQADQVTDVDRAHLAKICAEGLFKAWDCPHCSSHQSREVVRVFKASLTDEQEDWPNFQDCWDQDFGFFGDRDKYTESYIEAMCDTCRCHG